MKKASPRQNQAQIGGERENHFLPALLALIGICICAYLIYGPGLKNGFVYDDVAYVTENPILSLKGEALKEKILSTPVHGNYHPLTVASLAWDYAAAKLRFSNNR